MEWLHKKVCLNCMELRYIFIKMANFLVFVYVAISNTRIRFSQHDCVHTSSPLLNFPLPAFLPFALPSPTNSSLSLFLSFPPFSKVLVLAADHYFSVPLFMTLFSKSLLIFAV